jgi:DNA polymerase-3 subunit gamma/tau
LQLELLAARLLLATNNEGIAGIEQRIALLEKGTKPQVVSAEPVKPAAAPPKLSTITSPQKTKVEKVTVPVPPKKASTTKTSEPESEALPVADLAKLKALWPGVLETLKQESRVAWTTFSESVPLSVSDGVIAIAISDMRVLEFAQGSNHEEKLRTAIREVTKSDGVIALIAASDQTLGRESIKSNQGAKINDETIEEIDGLALLERELGARPLTDK